MSAPGARRRRFQRPAGGPAGVAESRAELEAEVVLLREENARLKAARHQQHDVGKLLERTRSMRTQELDRGQLADETAQMLVEGLVIRESLLEICREIERSMVAFEAKLDALATMAIDRPAAAGPEHGNGNGATPNGHGSAPV